MDNLYSDALENRLRKVGNEWLYHDYRYRNYDGAYQDFKYYFFEQYPVYRKLYENSWGEERLEIMDGIDVVLEPRYGCLRD